MRGHSDAKILRLGAITLVVLLVVMAASFNLQKFPGFGGDSYKAEFADAAGLRTGSMVQVAGTRVGRVEGIAIAGAKVVVTFNVDQNVDFGTQSGASIEVLNLLGEKFVNLTPAGDGQMEAGDTIPEDRTETSYDIVSTFGGLAKTVEGIDTNQLAKALDTLSTTVNAAAPEVEGSFDGLARLSKTISSRDAELQNLLTRSSSVARLLAERKGDITALIREGDLLLREVKRRREDIHLLLVNTASLARELKGLVKDNEDQIRPALQDVREVLGVLEARDKDLTSTLKALGPYVSILGNIIGTGPWFDAYVVNLFGIGSGEFQPGVRGQS